MLISSQIRCPRCGTVRSSELSIPCPVCGSRVKTILGFRVSGYTGKEMSLSEQDSHVALWGISGSGKSWLLRAFAKELEWYNMCDPKFTYELRNDRGNPIISDPFDVYPTAMPEDHIWEFRRMGRHRLKADMISSHQHTIFIHDDRGETMVDIVNDRTDYSTEIYSQTLQASRNIVVLLDPASIKSSLIQNRSVSLHTQDDYERWIDKLIEIGLKGNRYIRVAVCLSKSDLIPNYLPAEELISAIFGKNLISIVRTNQVESSFFRVSSIGITRVKGKNTSNISAENTLLDPERWSPINVVSPFFWLFERRERERIMQSDSFGDRIKSYIGYAPPKMIYFE